MKRSLVISIMVLLAIVSFFAGRTSALRRIGTYTVNDYRVAFHADWPTYGLPLADYESLLSLLKEGRPDQAIPRIEALLDMAIYDAMKRRPLLKGDDLRKLDGAIVKVAQYRARFPRPQRLDLNSNDPDYHVGRILSEVDLFLAEFRDNLRKR